MVLYMDNTPESDLAFKVLRTVYGDVPCAPASGSQLPEFVIGGVSYIGLREIEKLRDLRNAGASCGSGG